jgi:hypothetical protein
LDSLVVKMGDARRRDGRDEAELPVPGKRPEEGAAAAEQDW